MLWCSDQKAACVQRRVKLRGVLPWIQIPFLVSCMFYQWFCHMWHILLYRQTLEKGFSRNFIKEGCLRVIDSKKSKMNCIVFFITRGSDPNLHSSKSIAVSICKILKLMSDWFEVKCTFRKKPNISPLPGCYQKNLKAKNFGDPLDSVGSRTS